MIIILYENIILCMYFVNKTLLCVWVFLLYNFFSNNNLFISSKYVINVKNVNLNYIVYN